MTLDIADYKVVSWTVSKGVQDALWLLSAEIDKHVVPAFFEMIQATARDHNNNPRTPFVGIIPATDYTLAASANKSAITGYDYGWYLTVQYVPSGERTTEEDTNPSDTITTLLGGTEWANVTGIKPHRINTVTDWTNIKKSFEFGDRCTRWKAVQEICDYCDFVFVVKWRDVSGTWQPSAYFVHEDDIDSSTAGLDIPAAVTITNPDAHLMDGVSVKDSPEHRYNRVLTTGYDAATDTYFYATAQTGTEIPIEYVHADSALNTQAKTEAKAQELLDFFQASAKVYVARFKHRMDLELYQKINFVGYQKIEQEEMRITRITYSRSVANDIVEIEFSKDQAIQQLRRLARAVNPDYVSGTLGLVKADMSDVGLIDAFDIPIAGGSASDDLWTTVGAGVELIDSKPVGLQGESLTRVGAIAGEVGTNLPFWGSDSAGAYLTEFMRWRYNDSAAAVAQYLEIEEDIYLNNGSPSKIYFGIDYFRPTYISGYAGTLLDTLDLTVGGSLMMRLNNHADADPDYIGCYENLLLIKDLIVGGRIEGDGTSDLVFWDNATGQKTLSELATEGGVTDHGDLTGLEDNDHPQYLLLAGGTMAGNIDMADDHNIYRVKDISGSTSYPLTIYNTVQDIIIEAGGVNDTDIEFMVHGTGKIKFTVG